MATTPDVGLMRHRVMVQQLFEAKGPTGQLLKSWVDQVAYWAHVEPLSGRQSLVAMQVKVATWYRVRMRTNIVMTVLTNRLVYQGRAMNIESVYRVDERPGYYEILCTELKIK